MNGPHTRDLTAQCQECKDIFDVEFIETLKGSVFVPSRAAYLDEKDELVHHKCGGVTKLFGKGPRIHLAKRQAYGPVTVPII